MDSMHIHFELTPHHQRIVTNNKVISGKVNTGLLVPPKNIDVQFIGFSVTYDKMLHLYDYFVK